MSVVPTVTFPSPWESTLPINWTFAGDTFNATPGAVNDFRWELVLGNILPRGFETSGIISVTNYSSLIEITNYAAPNGVRMSPYSFQFAAASSSPATWAVTNGTLPFGLSLNTSGLLSGTPTTVGSSTFTVTAATPTGSDSKTITIEILATGQPPQITAFSPPNAVDGHSYSYRFQASGVPEPTWSLAEGSVLPSGLTLNANGLLSGVPVFSESYNFTVVASNGMGTNATREITFGIEARTAVSNTTTPTLTISNSFADRGELVTVQFRVDNNPGFANMVFRVDFPEELTLVGFNSHPTLLDNRQFPEPEDDQHDNYFGWIAGTENFFEHGSILELTFAVSPTAQFGFKPITAVFESHRGQEFPSNEDEVELMNFEIASGGVTVRRLILGDIDGDGRVTSADATLLARWLLRQYVTIDYEAADLTGNGVELSSLSLLARWLVGHDVSHLMVNRT